MAFMAAMLDELMGRDRNLAPDDKQRGITWDDRRVCKYYLCGLCPHDLFTNTKSDLGPCSLIHDDELVTEFNRASPHHRRHVEEDFERMLEGHIRECDRRIARGHARLKITTSEAVPDLEDEKVKAMTEKINELMENAERLGCQGLIDESQSVLRLCDQIKEERRQYANQVSGISPIVYSSLKDEKLMQVCEVCSVFLIIGDAQCRIDDHLSGKQHVGYKKLRDTYKERQEAKAKAREERDKKRSEGDADREKRRAERDRGGDDRRKRSRSRDKSRRRSRSRDRGSRSTSEKKRSRSRDRSRRDRSRDRNRRDRSRDRKGDKSHDKGRDAREDSKGRSDKEGGNHTGGTQEKETVALNMGATTSGASEELAPPGVDGWAW